MATLTISPLEEKRVKALGFLSNKGTDNFFSPYYHSERKDYGCPAKMHR